MVIIAQFVSAQGKKDSVISKTKDKLGRATNKIDTANTRIHTTLDSLVLYSDSKSRAAFHKADSIRSGFQSKVDSLQQAYQKPVHKMDSVSRRLQHKLDSLSAIASSKASLPDKLISKYKSKLDSVTRAKSQKLAELNQKVDKLKSKATKGLKGINLPPQMQAPINKLKQSIQGYKIPIVNGKIPGVDLSSARLPGFQGFQLSSGNQKLPSLGNTKVPGLKGVGETNKLNGVTNGSKELSTITNQASGYGKDIQKITQGKMNEVKNLDKTAENEIMKTNAMGELKGKTGELDKYRGQLKGRPDSAALKMIKDKAKAELMKEATNHFKGQEAVLQQAMGQMSKLKTKYSEVKSIADLPKKLPNPLKGTPFIERIIPGITFQIYNKGHFLLDVNPVAFYRITPRLSAGAGWVERVAFDKPNPNTDRVYGPRTVFQVNWKKGFTFRFQPELLNTFVPPQLIPTPGVTEGQREWVWSAFVGMKKEFTVYKKIRGNTEVMYNLYNPESKSPYADRLVVRFGFEFPMKKKIKSKSL